MTVSDFRLPATGFRRTPVRPGRQVTITDEVYNRLIPKAQALRTTPERLSEELLERLSWEDNLIVNLLDEEG